MPRPISWLPRLPAITRRVEGSVRSHYDRADLEVLFELQPRAAQLLLEALPTTAVGRAHLVEREALLQFLEGMAEAENTAAFMEQVRSQKASVSRKKPRTLIPNLVRRDLEPVRLASLPESITLTRCRLEVSFRTLEDLAQSLYALAQAIDADGDEMARLYEILRAPEPPGESDDFAAMFAELEALEANRSLASGNGRGEAAGS
jgi:hypothetical protein